MSTWTLIQIVFDIFMACGLFVVVMRMNRAPKDDPRLSRGLALLQSKISVLEDLSDRTEAQVASMISVLESKAREVQAKVELADRHVAEIRVSMDRSLEVASIFQDKIPHKEIIERQNTIKYVQAARLAHSGLSVDEIATRVDLPRGELDFIVSVNRDRLMFSESELPEWARSEEASAATGTDAAAGAPPSGTPFINMNSVAEKPATTSAQTRGFDGPNGTSGSQNFANAINSLSFAGETPGTPDHEQSTEERARRLRAEIELAENQRLVENLSRLQNEMQNLDLQLARENGGRDLASAYDVPKVETDHLKKLGEEFRRAVREGEVADNKQPFGHGFGHATSANGAGESTRSFLPPLANLASLIPDILEAGAVQPVAQPPPHQLSPNQLAMQARAATQAVPQRAAAHQTPTPAAVPVAKDPVLARAVAQAKVQAALRSTARPSSVNRGVPNPELTQARAVARDLAGNIVAPAKPGEVRKIAFPRIDGSDL